MKTFEGLLGLCFLGMTMFGVTYTYYGFNTVELWRVSGMGLLSLFCAAMSYKFLMFNHRAKD